MYLLIGLGDDQPDSEKPNNETDGEWDPLKGNFVECDSVGGLFEEMWGCCLPVERHSTVFASAPLPL